MQGDRSCVKLEENGVKMLQDDDGSGRYFSMNFLPVASVRKKLPVDVSSESATSNYNVRIRFAQIRGSNASSTSGTHSCDLTNWLVGTCSYLLILISLRQSCACYFTLKS